MLVIPESHSAGRKNAAPAYRPANGRGGPHPHAVSLAYAAFFVIETACSEALGITNMTELRK